MRKTLTAMVFWLIFSSTIVSAIDYNQFENIEISNETVDQIKDYINTENPDNNAMETLKNTLGNEILEITLTETNQVFTITTNNGSLEYIKKGSDPNATITLKLNETVLEDLTTIESSNDPAQVILDAINSDKIEYSTTKKASLKTKILIFLSKGILKVVTFIQWIIP
ncbi:MAG: hypothetical protein K0B07_04015 [DPANN group archaeon]|nr:hypothetical protein [DPANN group archaeon]